MHNRYPIESRGALWVGLLILWGATFVYEASPLNEQTICLWKRWTTLNCAGCGLTRSFCAMSKINILGAFNAHPVGPFLYVAMAWYVTMGAVRKATGRSNLLPLSGTVIHTFWIMVAIVFALHLGQTLLSWA